MQTLERPQGNTGEKESPHWTSSPVVIVLATTLAFWLVSSIGMFIYTADVRAPTTYELVVPFGTGAETADGGNPLKLPSTWSFYAGDLLTVDNRDTELHQVGPWNFPPGTVYTIELQPNLGGVFNCSFHPAGQIVLDVQPRGYNLGLTLIPTLMAGPILGLIVVGIRKLMRALDEPADPSRS